MCVVRNSALTSGDRTNFHAASSNTELSKSSLDSDPEEFPVIRTNDDPYVDDTNDTISGDSNVDTMSGSHIGQTLSDLTTKRVIVGVLL